MSDSGHLPKLIRSHATKLLQMFQISHLHLEQAQRRIPQTRFHSGDLTHRLAPGKNLWNIPDIPDINTCPKHGSSGLRVAF